MKKAPGKLRPPLRRIIVTGCIVLWLAALVATHVPAEQVPEVRFSDWTLHALGYLALGSAFWLTLWAHGAGRWKRVMWVLGAMIVYAALDEITQPLVNRVASLTDWVADAAGAVIALAACELATKIFAPKRAG